MQPCTRTGRTADDKRDSYPHWRSFPTAYICASHGVDLGTTQSAVLFTIGVAAHIGALNDVASMQMPCWDSLLTTTRINRCHLQYELGVMATLHALLGSLADNLDVKNWNHVMIWTSLLGALTLCETEIVCMLWCHCECAPN